jgi:hypothetical protein
VASRIGLLAWAECVLGLQEGSWPANSAVMKRDGAGPSGRNRERVRFSFFLLFQKPFSNHFRNILNHFEFLTKPHISINQM